MSADIVQNLYLGALMDGLSFTVTDVITSVPDATGWTAAFTSESVGKRQSGPSVSSTLCNILPDMLLILVVSPLG